MKVDRGALAIKTPKFKSKDEETNFWLEYIAILYATKVENVCKDGEIDNNYISGFWEIHNLGIDMYENMFNSKGVDEFLDRLKNTDSVKNFFLSSDIYNNTLKSIDEMIEKSRMNGGILNTFDQAESDIKEDDMNDNS